MSEKIKLGIPIENEETGETNIILSTNEIRIIEEAFEEIERLNNIIKEVREYIVNNRDSDSFTELTSGKITDIEYCIPAFEDILEIVDKGE